MTREHVNTTHGSQLGITAEERGGEESGHREKRRKKARGTGQSGKVTHSGS